MDAIEFAMKHHGHWMPHLADVTSVTSDAQIADSEAMYQVMMLARASRGTSHRVFNLRAHDLPWTEILRRLTTEGECEDGADDQ